MCKLLEDILNPRKSQSNEEANPQPEKTLEDELDGIVKEVYDSEGNEETSYGAAGEPASPPGYSTDTEPLKEGGLHYQVGPEGIYIEKPVEEGGELIKYLLSSDGIYVNTGETAEGEPRWDPAPGPEQTANETLESDLETYTLLSKNGDQITSYQLAPEGVYVTKVTEEGTPPQYLLTPEGLYVAKTVEGEQRWEAAPVPEEAANQVWQNALRLYATVLGMDDQQRELSDYILPCKNPEGQHAPQYPPAAADTPK